MFIYSCYVEYKAQPKYEFPSSFPGQASRLQEEQQQQPSSNQPPARDTGTKPKPPKREVKIKVDASAPDPAAIHQAELDRKLALQGAAGVNGSSWRISKEEEEEY
jgi:hypothetical protein